MQNEDVTIGKNRSFKRILVLTNDENEPISLNGYTVKSQIRETAKESSAKIVDIVAEITDSPNGEITISLTPALTKDIEQSKGFYDVVTVDNIGNTETWLYGNVCFLELPTTPPTTP